MNKSSVIVKNSTEPIDVLSVSPMTEDHCTLESIFRQHSLASVDQPCELRLVSSWTLQKAITVLRIHGSPIAICERDLRPGTWQELLERTHFMPHSPLVIVTSRLADERMWAEALNLGAWDVLAKPFDCTEVIRVVDSALRHFQARQEMSAPVQKRWRAAG